MFNLCNYVDCIGYIVTSISCSGSRLCVCQDLWSF